MRGGRDRDEFGQSLDNAEEEGMEYVHSEWEMVNSRIDNGGWLMVGVFVWAIEDVRLRFFTDSITGWEFFFALF